MNWSLTGYVLPLSCGILFIMGILQMHTLYETSRSRRSCIIIWGSCLTVIIGLLFLVEYYGLFAIHYNDVIVASVMLLLGCIMIFRRNPVTEIIFASLFFHNLFSLLFLLARTVAGSLAAFLPEPWLNVLFLTFYGVSLIAYFYVFIFRHREVVRESFAACEDNVYLLLGFTLINYLALIVFSRIGGMWHLPDPILIIKNAILLLTEVIGYMLLFKGLTKTAEKRKIEEETKRIRSLMELSRQHYDSLTKNMQKVRMYNHDLKYIVKGLAALNQRKDYAGLDEFIRTLEKDAPGDLPVWSSIPEIDAVIAYCAECCEAEDIRFHCDFSLPRECGIQPMHLCIMLGNCLQNALEACRKTGGDQERFIYLLCFTASQKVAIRVENSFDGSLEMREGKLETTKEYEPDLHGYGMDSVRSIADKYHGSCTWETKGRKFTTNILLVVEE